MKRVIAMRALTGEILSWDVPLSTDTTFTRELSGPGGIHGKIEPVWASMLADDGRPMLEKWSTALFIEEDGEIRCGGIVIDLKPVGETLGVECAGYTTYPHGIPFMDIYRPGEHEDPLNVIRFLWGYVQSFPDSDLGVVLDDTMTDGLDLDDPPTITGGGDNTKGDNWRTNLFSDPSFKSGKGGFEPQPTDAPAGTPKATVEHDVFTGKDDEKSLKITWDTDPNTEFVGVSFTDLDRYSTYRITMNVKVPAGSPDVRVGVLGDSHGEKTSHKDRWVQIAHHFKATQTEHVVGVETAGPSTAGDLCHVDVVSMVNIDQPLPPLPVAKPNPYHLLWWDNVDCGNEIDRIMDLLPADYVEQHSWLDRDAGTIEHRVRLGWPRFGRKRDNLRFVEGENIVEVVQPEDNGDDFAQTVYGLGKGEGRKMARSHATVRDGRLRRVSVVVDKRAKEKRIDQRVKAELRKRRNEGLRVDSVTIRDHENARISQIRPGDDVLIQFVDSWYGDTRLWVRVLAVTEAMDGDLAVLSVQRSDDFNYARPVQN